MRHDDEFEWDDLLDYIKEQRVVPAAGGDLLTFSADDKTQTLDQWLALGLARELDIPLQGLTIPTSLNEVTHAYFDLVGGRQPRNKVYRKLAILLKDRGLPIPPALEQIAAIRHFTLFLSLGFDTLLFIGCGFPNWPATFLVYFS